MVIMTCQIALTSFFPRRTWLCLATTNDIHGGSELKRPEFLFVIFCCEQRMQRNTHTCFFQYSNNIVRGKILTTMGGSQEQIAWANGFGYIENKQNVNQSLYIYIYASMYNIIKYHIISLNQLKEDIINSFQPKKKRVTCACKWKAKNPFLVPPDCDCLGWCWHPANAFRWAP